MSAFTPVFPKTTAQPMRLASTASASTSPLTNIGSGVAASDAARLAQWHIALASLPAEVRPPSRPSSPSAQSRIKNLRAKICEAVKNNGDAREIVKLNSVLFGGCATSESYTRADATDKDGPWPLVETEEEWNTWEKDWNARRAAGAVVPGDLKGKHRGSIPLKAQPSLSSREKVASWQAGLQAVPPPSSPTIAPQSSQNKSKDGGNSLGFPVVKRTGRLKDVKAKNQSAPSQNAHPLSSSQNPRSVHSETPVPQVTKALRREEDAIPAQTTDMRLSQLPDASLFELPDFSKDVLTSTPKRNVVSKPKRPEPGESDSGNDNAREHAMEASPIPVPPAELRPTAAVEDDTTFTITPPSFPNDLPTSIPKPQEMFEQVGPSDNVGDSKVASIDRELVAVESRIEVQSYQTDEPMQISVEEGVIHADAVPSSVTAVLVDEIKTPPSPPASSTTPQPDAGPQHPTDAVETPRAEKHAFHQFNEPERHTTPPTKIARPLTPTSDSSLPAAKIPRTPERQTPRKRHTMSAPASPSRGVNTNTNNASTLPTTPTSLTKSLGNAKGLPFPRTPDRNRGVAPPHIDLLATSRRSKMRPSTASQKSTVSTNGEDEADVDAQLGSPSPTKSLFSSLASSSPMSGSSGSGPGSGSTGLMSITSRLSVHHAPRDPESPLQFTQNPSHFAPPLESTQPTSRHFASFARSPVSQVLTRHSTAKSTQMDSQTRLGRVSSGLTGMAYSSQFNVNEHVHRVTDFMEKDVDFNAWVHDNEDEDVVEVGTQRTPPMASSQL